MTELSYQIKLKILHLLFESTSTIGERNANLDCLLIAPYGKFRFQTCAIYNMHKQNWTLKGRQHRWLQPIHNDLVTNESLNSVYQELIKGLRPFWLGVRAVKSKGAVLEAGQSKITKKQQKEAILIWRPHLGDLYCPDWALLWDLIINRVEYDPEFTVHGIQKSRIKDAVQIIQSLYPWEWVKKRYKLALNDTKTQPTMDQDIDSDFWFPARLLARTAQGVICKDPGWNYLISLAEGIKAVKKFPNGEKLLKSNAKSQGIVHQINFSGYLDKRGILTDVNQPTGSGNDKHDFAVKIGKKDYDIEMKTLSSRNPGKTLKQEIMNRNCRLPRSPTHPIVYYVVLVERNISNLNEYENKTVKNFLAEITHDCFNETQKVAAIVVGEMFVDTSGGELKWSFNKFLINNKLKSSINELELRQIFVDNLKSLSYPLIPITFKLHLTKKP